MNKAEFNKLEKGIDNTDSESYEEQEGYKVIASDGYTSWSPKSVFENANRVVTEEEKYLINH